MARRNPPRSIGGEDNLALRIAMERETREWSYETLAGHMTRAGCPIQASALHRIEKGNPRRRVAVDELIALSQVFEVTIDDLLTDVDLLRRQALKALIDELEPSTRELMRAVADRVRLWMRCFELAASDPEAWDYVLSHWKAQEAEVEAGGTTFAELFEGEADLTELDEAVRSLFMATQWAASRIVAPELHDAFDEMLRQEN